MTLAQELADLFRRDVVRLRQQLGAFADDIMWRTLPGVSNSTRNLVLHLEGNFREFVGRQLGSIPYDGIDSGSSRGQACPPLNW